VCVRGRRRQDHQPEGGDGGGGREHDQLSFQGHGISRGCRGELRRCGLDHTSGLDQICSVVKWQRCVMRPSGAFGGEREGLGSARG
jgi:hypothetical protein